MSKKNIVIAVDLQSDGKNRNDPERVMLTLFLLWGAFFWSVFWTCIGYYFLIFTTQFVFKRLDIPALRLKGLFILHNLLLTAVSGVLLLLFIEQLVPIVAKHGFFYAVCNDDAWTQELEHLYYLNYLVKYWELIDTMFLAVKRKNIGTC